MSLLQRLARVPVGLSVGAGLSLALATWLPYRFGTKAFVALYGFSPLDWVNRLAFPQNFSANFPNGVESFGRSLFMYLYPVLASWTGAEVVELMDWVKFIEVLCLLGSVYAVTIYVTPKKWHWMAPLFFCVLASGGALGISLSNFSGPKVIGLYYGFADLMRILAIGMVLRWRPYPAAFFGFLSFATHPAMAVHGAIFAGVVGLVCWSQGRRWNRHWAIAAALAVVAALGWMVYAYRGAYSEASLGREAWLAFTRMMNFHWYPVRLGMFTHRHAEAFTPLLALIVLAVTWRPRESLRREPIVWGIGAMVALLVMGVGISYWGVSPTLIKLSFIRAMDLGVFYLLIFLFRGLGEGVVAGTCGTRFLAGYFFLSPLVGFPGFPLFPALLTGAGWLTFRRSEFSVARRRLLVTLIGVGVGVGLALLFFGFGETTAQQHSLWGNRRLVFWSVLLWAAVSLVQKLASHSRVGQTLRPAGAALVCLVFVVAFLGLPALAKRRAGVGYVERGEAYRQVQLWARDHTPPQALFLADPTIYYGWRDFSQRSSFGNLREWLMTSWMYTSDGALYQEGRRRADRFGLRVEEALGEWEGLKGYLQLHRELRKKFYGMPGPELQRLAREENIDFVVGDRALRDAPWDFPVAFENAHFTLYRVGESAEDGAQP